MIGSRTPYVNLFTKIKSPTCRVGIIEPEGILNGSIKRERMKNTTRMTGKKLLAYSTHHGSATPLPRLAAKVKRSSNQMPPVTSNNTNIISAKSIFILYSNSISKVKQACPEPSRRGGDAPARGMPCGYPMLCIDRYAKRTTQAVLIARL